MTASQQHSRFGTRAVVVLSTLSILTVLAPITQNWAEEPVDGFPFSYYPMFTADRGDGTWLTHPIGVRADGSRVNLSYKLAGTGGLNQVRRQIRKEVRADRAQELCHAIAAEVRNKRSLNDIVSVEIVRNRYLFDDFFNGDEQPAKSELCATCVVQHDVTEESGNAS